MALKYSMVRVEHFVQESSNLNDYFTEPAQFSVAILTAELFPFENFWRGIFNLNILSG